MKKTLLLIAILFIANIAFTSEFELTAFCNRPETNEVFVCGEFSTVLVLDISTGKSLRAFNIAEGLMDIQFSSDGKTLLARSLDEVFFINPKSGEIIKRMKISTPRLYPNSPYFADGDWYSKKTVSLYSTSDGSEVFSYDPEFNINSIGFNSDFTELIVISSKIDIENEQSLIKEKLTSDKKFDWALNDIIKQQSDNKGVKMDVIDLKTKKKAHSITLPYSFSTSPISSISKQGTDVYINSSRMFIKIDKEGAASPIIDGSYNSSTVTPIFDQQFLVGSTWNGGFIYNCKNNTATKIKNEGKFDLSNTIDMIEHQNKIYFLSNKFLIAEIDTDGNTKSQLTINNNAGNGFEVYCRIGFSDPEKKEEQVSIINKLSKKKDFKTEDFNSRDFTLISSFDDVNASKKFIKNLKEKGLKSSLRIAPKE